MKIFFDTCTIIDYLCNRNNSANISSRISDVLSLTSVDIYTLSEMERQDFINTINELRETIASLRMTIKTLQKTIDDLNANEKRHKKEIDGLHEMLEFFSKPPL